MSFEVQLQQAADIGHQQKKQDDQRSAVVRFNQEQQRLF